MLVLLILIPIVAAAAILLGAPARTTTWLEVLTVEHAKDGGLNTHRYESLTTHLGGHDYLSFIDLPDKPGKSKQLPYSFARYEVNWRGDLRVWIAEQGQHVSIRSGAWEDPFAWGIVLADLARHIALAHQLQNKDTNPEAFLNRLLEGFEAEIENPTDEPEGEVTQ